MDYETLQSAAAPYHLTIVGAFHPDPEDGAPEGTETLVLFAPAEPTFWPHFKKSPEYSDGAADPMNRWSTRALSAIAEETRATPLFPFGGPPYLPFISWALKSGSIHASPVTLLVHNDQGLMISFRGALALRERISLSPPRLTPCLLCPAPCETACPVNALSEHGYDTAACHAYLDTPAGTDCLTRGCKARRACPISQDFSRNPEQSAYHMRSFHP
ncbi:ferredoxin [Gymnodinialimonas ceratoperidinii]|uniref:Ferredoxin n=1 Tax=Gymnodinialimonas ceratoperidinii TaxID=2856823 RepID=A0A8F6TWU0_9RHOB|nr:ferredoxin [Gymnodinialimonas ceratoperidinii]QXT39619.1 ferredoxin [Gymnodinialimonas ceratoperidinii]